MMLKLYDEGKSFEVGTLGDDEMFIDCDGDRTKFRISLTKAFRLEVSRGDVKSSYRPFDR